MPKAFVPQILMANHLREGHGLYLDAKGKWSRERKEAWRLESPEELEKAMEIAEKFVRDNLVLDPEAVAVNPQGEPIHPRARIRAFGPSLKIAGKSYVSL